MRIDNPTFNPGGINTAATASVLVGGQATYLTVGKNGIAQTLNTSTARLTNWDAPVVSINAGEWNGTTGLFTATKPGTYLVTVQLQTTIAAWSAGQGIAVIVTKNATGIALGNALMPATVTTFCNPANATGVVTLAVGDTLSIFANAGISVNTNNSGTTMTIQEIPTRLQR